MLFRNKALPEINEGDLKSLIADRVGEQRTLDYKLELPPANPPEKKREFLADICSFANSAGGFLLYGIREEDGYPIELVGIDPGLIEAESGRLIQAAQDGIEPKVPGVLTRRVPLANGREVLIFAIPKSWAAPHAVWFEKNSKFWARNADRKFQLSVPEIRNAMIGSHQAAEAARRFRDGRLSRIQSGEMPVRLTPGPLMVLQVMPIESFHSSPHLDILNNIPAIEKRLEPIYSPGGRTPKWVFDGYLWHNSAGKDSSTSYAQLFRNGVIEAVDTNFYRTRDKLSFIPSRFVEPVSDALGRYVELQTMLGVEGPVLISFALLNVRGFTLGFNNPWGWNDLRQIDEEHLIAPEVYVDDRGAHPEVHLRSAFDAVWNACGLAACNRYSKDGRLTRE